MSMIDYQIKNLERLFSESGSIEVPFFQRPYSWSKDEYLQFLDDVKRVYDQDHKNYFLGSIFLKQKDKSLCSVIDGQQRLTTATILIAAIRDLLFNLKSDKVSDIELYFLQRKNLRTDEAFDKLRLGALNSDFFQKYILRKQKPEEKFELFAAEQRVNDSNKLLFDCYKKFYEALQGWIKKYDDKKKILLLIDILGALIEKFEILSITVTDDQEAFTVFETLNDRGLDLTIADLLKNYIFSILDEKIDKNRLGLLLNKWDKMIDNLGKNTGSFFKHYWNSKNKPIGEKEIYRALKGKHKSKAEILSFLDDLFGEAEIYYQLMNPELAYWKDKNIVELLGEMSVLGVKQCFPLLLSARSSFKNNDFIKVLEYCVNLSFAYSTVCNLHNNKLEGVYSDVANKLRAREYRKISYVRKSLKPLFPKEEIFNELFLELKYSSPKIPKYILRKINDSLDLGREIRSHDEVTLEHIVPEVIAGADKDHYENMGIKHKDVVTKLTNMTILGEEYNRHASSARFEKKKIMYKKSKLAINRKLKRIKHWDDKSHLQWGQFLLERSKEIWSL
jgi:uncharacterized protein with ParB-like and HNH nuclease domain